LKKGSRVRLVSKDTMAEVQKHGFKWERDLLTNVYKATPEELKRIRYNSKFDLPAEFNHLSKDNISVKTTGTPNTICMGDALRVFDEISSGESFHLVVVTYKQEGENKILESVVELNLTGAKEALFGPMTRSQLDMLDTVIKAVPANRSPTAEEKVAIKDAQQVALTAMGSSALYLNPKCNSTQSRLQCSFNKFTKFVSEHPELVVARSDGGIFRGSPVLAQIQSPPRSFARG
jgi:hypothetical protein